MEQNLVLCKRTENAGFDKKRGPGNSWGGGGECLGCFPMENVYNPFLRLQHRWDLRPSSKGAAEVYDSGVSEQFPFQAVIGALPPSHLYLSTGFLRVTPPPRAAPRVSPRVEGS